MKSTINKIIESRNGLKPAHNLRNLRKSEEEGGCGVVGFASSVKVPAKHIYRPSVQMHNRGNGKGGGISAVGLKPEDLGVSQDILDHCYLIQVAYLNPDIRENLENEFIKPHFNLHHQTEIPHIDDYRDIEGLDLRPPDVWQYFVRVKRDVLESFIEQHDLNKLDDDDVEDEFIYQNSYNINRKYYASGTDEHAFVLSYGKDIMVLKLVGYAEHIPEYYKLMDLRANVWIAHQRYPTKGKVWHPGGAHPFVGLNTALVHNGDFANYHSITEYLAQRNIYSLFLTDTEVSILLFDLFSRTYQYPLEYVIEALAPTTERDFKMLPTDKKEVYKSIQTQHMQSSPDGPWFFIIAKNDTSNRRYQLIGITDTSMLRPQVFALQKGEVEIGLIASEKQAIDATLESLSETDRRFLPIADKYWNARGGSHTDGGSFIFNIQGEGDEKSLNCTDKFGEEVHLLDYETRRKSAGVNNPTNSVDVERDVIVKMRDAESPDYSYNTVIKHLPLMSYEDFKTICDAIATRTRERDISRSSAIELLTRLNDRRYPLNGKRRSLLLTVINSTLTEIFSAIPPIPDEGEDGYTYIDFYTMDKIREPTSDENILVVNASDFPPEGPGASSHLIVRGYEMGWRRFIVYGYRGQRFCGCGLGPDTDEVRIDVYGSSGDYLASGIDGMEIYVHGDGQDQLGQIMKRGKLVVYGDVGQTFMYGAKGGDVYIQENAAGRPLINAVGKPKVVINGTCLDYLAESFMAGDPLNGGGFVVLNGIRFGDDGEILELESPYPGGNLFSLASGGAIYVRDPHRKLEESQLNGGVFSELTDDDWSLIKPRLEENGRLFGISTERLLTVADELKKPEEVYRVVRAVKLSVLTGKEEQSA